MDNVFTLAGGKLSGATVLPGSGGQGLTLTSSGGTLSGVTIASGTVVDGTQALPYNDPYATIVGGLTLNGEVD
ncbi:MAG TPA: hypothetical protein VGN12_08025, partial [Pirellulales bacterium]